MFVYRKYKETVRNHKGDDLYESPYCILKKRIEIEHIYLLIDILLESKFLFLFLPLGTIIECGTASTSNK